MRKILGSLALVGVTVLGGMGTSLAQSAYDYPWCALRDGKAGGQSCYYTSYQQCMATMSGIGGSCVRSPYYNGPEPQQVRRYERY